MERVYNDSAGTPTRQAIREMAVSLEQYGPISYNNLYNWFQNRKARAKRKAAMGGGGSGSDGRPALSAGSGRDSGRDSENGGTTGPPPPNSFAAMPW